MTALKKLGIKVQISLSKINRITYNMKVLATFVEGMSCYVGLCII